MSNKRRAAFQAREVAKNAAAAGTSDGLGTPAAGVENPAAAVTAPPAAAVTDHTFDASWPILQPDRPLADLIDEALDLFAEMAELQRIHVIGEATWSIVNNRMRVAAPAAKATSAPRAPVAEQPVGRQSKVQAHIDEIRHWATVEHLTDDAITARLLDLYGVDCDRSAVRKARQRNSIPPRCR